MVGVDAEMAIDRRQEISGGTSAFDGFFATLVGGPDNPTGWDAAASPEIGEGLMPVVSPWLLGSGGELARAFAGAGTVVDFGRAAKLSGDDHQDSLVQSALVDVFNQRRDGLVIGRCAESQGIEDVMIHGVVIPGFVSAALWPAQANGENFHAGFH